MQNNPHNPYTNTLDTKIAEAISNVLNNIAPGVGPLATDLIKDPMYKMLGLSKDDNLLNIVFDTNQTPFGVYQTMQNRAINRAGKHMVHNLSNAARLNAFRGLSRTITPYDEWKKLPAGIKGASYNEYIEMKALEKSANVGWQIAHDILDPNNIRKATPYLENASTNMVRKGMNRGDRDSFAKASKVIGSLFLDDNGRYNFNSKDYGYMTISDVAGVAANITRDMDVLSGTKGLDKESIKNASDKFKKTIKDYSEALAPLKDVFGSDIQKMLRTLESVTGSTMSSMGATRVREVANHIADNLAVGTFTSEELFAVNSQFKSNLKKMPGVSRFNSRYSLGMASDTLAASADGNIPVGMERAEFASNVAKSEAGVAGGRMAEIADLSYAGWANAQRAKYGAKADVSLNAFKKAIATIQGNTGMSTMAAMMRLGGSINQYDAQKNRAFSSYRDAKSLGIGRNIARDEYYSEIKKGTIDSIARSGYLRSLSKSQGASYHTEATDRATVTKAVNLLENNNSLLSADLSDNDMLVSIYNLTRGKGEQEIKSINDLEALRGTSKHRRYIEVMRLKQSMELIKNDDNNRQLLEQIHTRHNVNKQIEQANKARKRRAAISTMKLEGISTLKDNFFKIMGMDTGEGYSEKRFSQIMSSTDRLRTMDSEVKEEARAAMVAAADSYKAHNLMAKVNITETTKFGTSLFDTKATSDDVRKAYIEKIDKERGTKEGRKAYRKWFNEKFKKREGNENIGINHKKAIQTYMDEEFYQKDMQKLSNHAVSAANYAITETGLSNFNYREQLKRYIALEKDKSKLDPTKDKDKISAINADIKEAKNLMEISKHIDGAVLDAYVSQHQGLDATKNEKDTKKIRAANLKELASIHSKGGLKAVQKELKRRSISSNIKELRDSSKYGSAVKDIEAGFIASRSKEEQAKFKNKGDLFAKENMDAFNFEDYDKYLADQSKEANKEVSRLRLAIKKATALGKTDNDKAIVVEHGKGLATVAEARRKLKEQETRAEALSSLTTGSNRGKQGMDAILVDIKDVLKTLANVLQDFAKLNGQRKAIYQSR